MQVMLPKIRFSILPISLRVGLIYTLLFCAVAAAYCDVLIHFNAPKLIKLYFVDKTLSVCVRGNFCSLCTTQSPQLAQLRIFRAAPTARRLRILLIPIYSVLLRTLRHTRRRLLFLRKVSRQTVES